MNLDEFCNMCGCREDYPRKEGTTYICSMCVQRDVLRCKGMAEVIEKAKVPSRRSKGIRIQRKRQTLGTCDLTHK
jgi:hypothetical protein